MQFSQVANWIGWDQRTVGQEILDSINKYEHSQKRPLLSALVVEQYERLPKYRLLSGSCQTWPVQGPARTTNTWDVSGSC